MGEDTRGADESVPGGFDAIERRWRQEWEERRAYEPAVQPDKPKFFATYPYSYMNSYAHVGHAYTMGRVDFFIRYQRMRGKNTLFPFAYHLTGTPIMAAANRVRDGEPTQIQILRDQGFSHAEIKKFADPWHWTTVFPAAWREDVSRLGMAIDWRRQFFTTEKNPHYDRFVRWQFRRLKEKGFVAKGRHPVIYCPKDKHPVADHDRKEGEGETPQPHVLVKLRLVEAAGRAPAGAILAAATLRPETMFGQTNAWVDPELEYRVVRVGSETWVVSPPCAAKLPHQFEGVTEIGPVQGRDLVGKRVRVPARDTEVLVLPASFVRADKGTGIVTSVPSDAPFDWIALEDLKRDEGAMRAFGLDAAVVRGIKPIPVIETPGLGGSPAAAVCQRLKVKSQRDAELLERATDEVYKGGFYSGVMNANAGQFAGKPVSEAKEAVARWLVSRGEATGFYEPSGRVVCRCLTEAIVKIVEDQWFMRYGDEAWKKRAHEALDGMRIHPDVAKKQFHYVVDWLRDWACARESGLGTRLPWDERWIIESLSDSTIYMAYYTICHLFDSSVGKPRHAVKAEDLTDAFFDDVFLGKGSAMDGATGSLTPAIVEECRREFSYWYPLDFRNSGKDLLQNHLTFMVFNHVALFPQDRWPRGIGVNGWVTVDGQKMSKQAGNFITLRQALDEYGVSAVRMALANAGEGLDDASFERDFAAGIERRLKAWLTQFQGHGEARPGRGMADKAFASALNRIVRDATHAMEETSFRTALKLSFFDLQAAWQYYLRRAGTPNADRRREYLEASARLMAPFIPHIAEEAWNSLGKQGSVIDAPWPEWQKHALDPDAEAAEAYLQGVVQDVREILKVTGISPTRIVVFAAEPWKRAAMELAARLASGGRLDTGAFMKAAQGEDVLKPHMKELPKLAAKLQKEIAGAGKEALEERLRPLDELALLSEAQPWLEREIPARWKLVEAGKEPDAGGKAAQALPRRPAIYVE